MSKKDWKPKLYLKFNKERIQPSIDLISRIDVTNPSKIIDIGCGPGNSTQIIKEKWAYANILGIDSSPAMIEKARKDYPNQEWKVIDAGIDEIKDKFDIVFSNAVIQWIPNHYSLFKKIKKIVAPNGLIAMQLPLFFEMPLGQIIAKVAKQWSTEINKVTELFTINDYSFYYDSLSELFGTVEMWETTYFHIFDSHLSIIEMMKSTGLKPYLDILQSKKDKKTFESIVLQEIRNAYPLQKNEKVLLPFKRLFFIAKTNKST